MIGANIIRFILFMTWLCLTTIMVMSVIGALVMFVTQMKDTWGKIPEELYPDLFKQGKEK